MIHEHQNLLNLVPLGDESVFICMSAIMAADREELPEELKNLIVRFQKDGKGLQEDR